MNTAPETINQLEHQSYDYGYNCGIAHERSKTLKAFPTNDEFEESSFQRGYVEAMRQVRNINIEAKESLATEEQVAERTIDWVVSSLYRYEPGHDKSSKSF